MSELLTLDLESPPLRDDASVDGIIKRAERKAKSLRRVVTRKAEVRLAETGVCFDDMTLDEQAYYGSTSKYFFKYGCLERSQMMKLGKLVEKYNGGEHGGG